MDAPVATCLGEGAYTVALDLDHSECSDAAVPYQGDVSCAYAALDPEQVTIANRPEQLQCGAPEHLEYTWPVETTCSTDGRDGQYAIDWDGNDAITYPELHSYSTDAALTLTGSAYDSFGEPIAFSAALAIDDTTSFRGTLDIELTSPFDGSTCDEYYAVTATAD